ncbi:acetyl-CoA synthetase [Halobacteriales archaeon QS_9_70_65]|nr:MAG: acetyl-CoA synthetase [Halobacteriales archaeon QS_9_70_65]
MDALGDLIGRDRRSEAAALRASAVDREYDYRRFCTSAWKVGNFLRHLGVRGGDGVAVADDPLPEPVLTLYGAALLGGVVRFDPPTAPDDGVRAVVVDVWSENPSMPPDIVAPGDPLLRSDGVTYSHGEVLEAAEAVVERTGIDVGGEVGVAAAASFADPGVVAAGLVAPIVAGGTVAVGSAARSDVVVGPGGDVDPETVLES